MHFDLWPRIFQEAAETLFEMSYCETSAKDDTNVDSTFRLLAEEIMKLGLIGGDDYFEHAERQMNIVKVTSTTPNKRTDKKSCCAKS